MSRVRLVTRDGIPRIERDGRSEPAWMATTPDPDPEWMERMARAGFRTFSFSATANFHLYGLAAPVWKGPGLYDWSEFDARMETILARVPDAVVVPRLHLASPPWWDRDHPDELVGFGVPWESAPPGHAAPSATQASWASSAWKSAVFENLERWVAHVESRPWADRVVGVLLCGGDTEEWNHVGSMRGLFPDVGRRSVEGFRTWLRRRYGDDTELSRAWGRAASCTSVAPPSVERRRGNPMDPWIDVRKDRDVVDFHHWLSSIPATFVGEAAAFLHAQSTHDVKVGAWCGYLAEMTFHPDALRFGGTLAFESLLTNEALDFFAAPSSYALRDLRRGATVGMLPRGSLRVHGKAGFHESDVRTHVLRDDAGYGRTETLAESMSVLEREAAFASGTGLGMWWFDMTGTFHDEPAVLERLGSLGRRAGNDHPVAARGAVVVDESVLEAWNGYPDRLTDALPRLLVELGRTGIDFETIRLADVSRASNYDILVFPAFERVEPDALARIDACRGRARLTVFTGRVGLAPTTGGVSPGPARVTGLPLVVSSSAVPVDSIAADGRFLGRGFWSSHDLRPESDVPMRVAARRVADDVPSACWRESDGVVVAWMLDHFFDAAAWRRLFEDAGIATPVIGDAAVRHLHDGLCVTSADDVVTLRSMRSWVDAHSGEVFPSRDGRVVVPTGRGETRRLRRQ